MNQELDTEEWPAIEFQGELLPQSVSGIHILIYQPLSERTLDWIWKLPHCKEVWKDGEPDWCISSAAEISDHLLDHRDEIIRTIQERLGPEGFDGTATHEEWLTAMSRISELAKRTDGICRWIAGQPTEQAETFRRQLLDYFDRHEQNNQ